MNLAITINMKNKMLKWNDIKIKYIEEERLSNMSDFFYSCLVENKSINLIIEERSLDDIKLIQKIQRKNKNFKIILLCFDKKNIHKYSELQNVNFIYLNKPGYIGDIKKSIATKIKEKNDRCNNKSQNSNKISAVKKKYYKSGDFKNKGMHWNVSENDFIKKKISQRTVIGLSLDDKVYSTTYLINYSIALAQENKTSINLYEMEGSLISVNKIYELNKYNINYKKFSIINMINVKDKNFNIIDLGRIDDLEVIKEILNNEYLKVIVFTTDCLKVNENDNYLKKLRFLEKHNEVVIVNRRKVFDRKIQENKKFLKSKIILKNIKKNNLLKGKNV